MILKKLFDAVDARPFRPFTIELLSGKRVPINHPENIHLFPTRQNAHIILVYDSEAEIDTFFYPDGIVALETRRRNGARRSR